LNTHLEQLDAVSIMFIGASSGLTVHIIFDVGVTFEMREPNTEKSIFRLIMIAVSQHLLNERVKGKVAERQRERERSECASVG